MKRVVVTSSTAAIINCDAETYTEAQWSEPERCSGLVMRASPPQAVTVSRMRGSSVATMTRLTRCARRTFSKTCATRGRPPATSSGFPGRRVLP